MPNEITFQALNSSGSTVGDVITVYAREIDDALSNKIFLITPPRGQQTHSLGPQNNKVINLLRMIQTIVITGEITGTSSKTAKQIKDDFINIYEGITGGDSNKGVRLVYDGDNIQGVIEKLAFNEKVTDEPSSPPEDFAKYTVQITFLKGVSR